MAKIVAGEKKWSVTIRCAHPVCGMGVNRVDGCFALIEIELEDIDHSTDWEGDTTFWVICPSCGQKLYPKWQIGDGPLNVILRTQENAERVPPNPDSDGYK
ncbi:hypothetical protein HQ487_05325 [Candidatus Uhrbacteria bacterium]|nr:hypothetical protein [Candidatus Uhrbacteria bacterium]